MTALMKDDAKTHLEVFHPRIRSVVEKAWSETREIAKLRAKAGIAPILYRRTLSNDVFDAIARYAIAEFSRDTHVRLKIESQTIKLFFGGLILARFKRGGGNKLGRNNPTQAVLAFIGADGVLPGLPPETAKVEFIWLSNDIQTTLEHVLVVARDGNRLLWEYEIESAATAGDVVPFPSRDPDSDDENMVRPRLPAPSKKEDKE